MSEDQITGNKGEWSEIYVFFKLLADGVLHAADSDLQKIEEIYYPIIKIIRQEISGNWEYYKNSVIRVVNGETGETAVEIPVEAFKNNATRLLEEIRESSARAFAIPSIETFMNSIEVRAIKANPQEKRDITIIVHDLMTGINPTLGFSIKSQLGSPSTLLNASRSTNFIYKIVDVDINQEIMEEINNIDTRSKIRDRLNRIEDIGGRLIFVEIENETFELNLKLIDSRLAEIMSELLLDFFRGVGSKINDLIEEVKVRNPCNFNLEHSHPFYEYKIKSLLSDIALGMIPTAVWDGLIDSTGGIIIVREDGEVLCYHIYNKNEFQDFLLNNTKLESSSSSRHNYGLIYEEKSEYYFKLNLQIRFIK
ncbi:MAG: HpaII family restriction endonuclease [Promethearchaeota archaeon]